MLKPVQFILALSFAIFADAYGQRGVSTHTDSVNDSPSRGLQGLFDTELTKPGKFGFDFPSFQMEYGINDRWSIGVNSLATLAFMRLKTPLTLGIKARHSLYSADSWRVVASGYYFQIPIKLAGILPEQDVSSIYKVACANINFSKSFNRNTFGISTLYGLILTTDTYSVEIKNSDSEMHVWSSALWWRWHLDKNFGTELLGFFTPAIVQLENTPQIQSRATDVGFAGPSFLRVLLNWRASEKWLWSAGAIALHRPIPVTTPYLGFTIQFPQTDSINSGEEQFQ